MSEYVHVVYGTSFALIRDPDGAVREATFEELQELDKHYAIDLIRSFMVTDP